VSWSELMPSGPGTPPAVTAAELEAAVFHVGLAVWREARTLGIRLEVTEDLEDALEVYRAILSGQMHPGAAWHDLEHSPEPRAEALSRAAGDILRWTAELIRQAPAAAEAAA
jgi:hypothetical protein